MERQMFYEGDILFHKRFGWGVVAEVSWNDFHDEHSYFIDFVDKKTTSCSPFSTNCLQKIQ